MLYLHEPCPSKCKYHRSIDQRKTNSKVQKFSEASELSTSWFYWSGPTINLDDKEGSNCHWAREVNLHCMRSIHLLFQGHQSNDKDKDFDL